MRQRAVLLLLLAACGHSEPFGPVAPEAGPFAPRPEQLTFNEMPDLVHGFSATGEELFYTFCEDRKALQFPHCGASPLGPSLQTRNTDRCLGALPVAGGPRTLELCGSQFGDADSIKNFVSGTRLRDGSLVFIYWSRRLTASFSTNAALYLWRPGAHAPVRLFAYRAAPLDGGVPTKLLAVGDARVASIGGDGSEIVTLHADNSVTREPVPGMMAIDRQSGDRLLLSNGFVSRVTAATGAVTPLGRVTIEPGWESVEILDGGIVGGNAVLVQRSIRVVAGTAEIAHRLIRFHPSTAPDTVLTTNSVGLGGLAVAPSDGSLVVEMNGDLFRYTLP